MTKINIAFITDVNYIMQIYVVLKSIFDTKSANSTYNIHVLLIKNGDTGKANILNDFNADNFIINIIEIMPDEKEPFMQAVLLKLDLPGILPNCDKILYLDADIIVNKDLGEIYNISLEDKYIAAVPDIYPMYYHRKFTKKAYTKYFNAGIMLLNLDLIRKSQFFKKVKECYYENNGDFFWNEQDVLNNLIGDKVKFISPKYNWITINEKFTLSQLERFYGEKINKKDLIIIHYAGGKPWKYYPYWFGTNWNKYFKLSPFYDKNIKRNKKYNWFIRWCAFIKNQIEILLNKGIYKQINIIK